MTKNFEKPRQPVLIEEAFDDPERIREFVRRNGPYWPTIRYVANPSELQAVGSSGKTLTVVPWFRADWAYDEALVEGAAEILDNRRFIEAARTLFDGEVVRPRIVYVNVMGPMGVGPAHIDVPAFRGIERTDYPVTFLHLMHRSGLFEAHRVAIATAVAWFYEGERGEFEYWPDGLSAPPRRIEGPLSNRAVVGDNDVMFHRVAPIGGSNLRSVDDSSSNSSSDVAPGSVPDAPLDATLDVELIAASEGTDWRAVDRGRELRRYDDREIRVSVSWKAEVFANEAAAQIRSEHIDDLSIDDVVTALLDDLEQEGRGVERPEDPIRDESFIRALNEAYPLPVPGV